MRITLRRAFESRYIIIYNNDVINTGANATRLNGFTFERAISAPRQWDRHRRRRRTEQKLPPIAKLNPILSTQSTLVSTSTCSISAAARPQQSKCILKNSLRSWGDFALWNLRNIGQNVFYCVDMVHQSGRRRKRNLSYFSRLASVGIRAISIGGTSEVGGSRIAVKD